MVKMQNQLDCQSLKEFFVIFHPKIKTLRFYLTQITKESIQCGDAFFDPNTDVARKFSGAVKSTFKTIVQTEFSRLKRLSELDSLLMKVKHLELCDELDYLQKTMQLLNHLQYLEK